MQCEPSSRHKKCHNYCGSLCTLVASSFLCSPHEQASKNGVIYLPFSMTTRGPKKKKDITMPWSLRCQISYSPPMSTRAQASRNGVASLPFLYDWLVDQKRRKTSLCQDRRLRLTIKKEGSRQGWGWKQLLLRLASKLRAQSVALKIQNFFVGGEGGRAKEKVGHFRKRKEEVWKIYGEAKCGDRFFFVCVFVSRPLSWTNILPKKNKYLHIHVYEHSFQRVCLDL